MSKQSGNEGTGTPWANWRGTIVRPCRHHRHNNSTYGYTMSEAEDECTGTL